MSGSIYDPQRLLIVKRKKEGRKREEQGREMLNHRSAEDTQTLKGTADHTMLLPISRIKEWPKSLTSLIKTQFPFQIQTNMICLWNLKEAS